MIAEIYSGELFFQVMVTRLPLPSPPSLNLAFATYRDMLLDAPNGVFKSSSFTYRKGESIALLTSFSLFLCRHFLPSVLPVSSSYNLSPSHISSYHMTFPPSIASSHFSSSYHITFSSHIFSCHRITPTDPRRHGAHCADGAVHRTLPLLAH